MEIIILIFSIGLILGKDDYEELINEQVTEQYCNDVISNYTKLLNETYIYEDILKAPIQPKKNESYYINKLDLLNELENISKTNRTFYDFIRDIYTIIRKTKDGHLRFYARTSPNNKSLSHYSFILPFNFEVKNNFDENGNVNDTYLTIKGSNLSSYYQNYSSLLISDYLGKKIISINDNDPFKFIEESPINTKFLNCHSLQSNYIVSLDEMTTLNLLRYPFKKEELPFIKFKFEEGELNVNYEFIKFNNNNKLHQFYLEKIKNNINNNMPLPSFKEVEREFQHKKKLNYNKEGSIKIDWDYSNIDGNIKCKIDKENKINVFYQNSFNPDNFGDYENTMFKCLSEVYSNKYEIIVIEDRNVGGDFALCFPFTQYLRPKILKTLLSTQKDTELNYESLIFGNENLNYETCIPYSSRNELNRNKVDIYKDGDKEIIHNITKEFELYSIYSKKSMEEKRREYLATNKTKKPTEIIVFTDGFSFSCTSAFIKGLQVYGSAILVGYNSKPNITKIDFDASQSNSAINTFYYSEYTQNLRNLGISIIITSLEQFDPNDKNEAKIPMEYKIYPVDIISNISSKYEDIYYERFIKEAKLIFERYNKKNECNADNSLLYYEISECDSKINIEHGHGGYLCGKDGYWNKSNCILAYCDVGYILNNDKNKCIEDPCENIMLNNMTLSCEKELKYEIEPKKAYIFTIDKNNGNCSYTFYSELDNFFFIYNEDYFLEPVKNGTEFTDNVEVYTNFYLNTTENIKITIISKNEDENKKEEEIESVQQNNTFNLFTRTKKKNKLSTAGIILISIFGSLAAIILTVIICILSSKKKVISEVTYPTDNDGSKKSIGFY